MMMYIIIGIACLVGIIVVVLLLPNSGKQQQKGQKYRFELSVVGGRKITFADPFDNFLVYGGTNCGKTKSIGKPLLSQYIQVGFAGFVYNYKDFDLARTAVHLVKKHNYPYGCFQISFTDMERTHRTNPIRPSVVKNETLFLQLMDDMLTAYQGRDGKRDEWFNGALGILRGVSIRFYNDYPQFCTIPHIVNFICSAGTVRITSFLEGKHQSRVLAGAFLDAKDSPKTQSSYLSSLTNSLSTLANEKKVCYVLSGNDFDFNLIDPECPKLVVVSNAYQIENLISPVISLMLSISSRRFTLANKVPFFYFLDEATTFRIADFEKLPSVLREYLCSFVFLTQSAAKIEKIYGKYDRSSIESNFGNQFFGRTKDIEALKSYPLVFGKEERQRVSKTTGSGRGGENRSRTISTQKEEIYDTNFFTSLKSGEFVGSAAHSNMRDFHLRFEMYEDKEDPLPIVHPVLASDIEENYQQIIKDIQGIE